MTRSTQHRYTRLISIAINIMLAYALVCFSIMTEDRGFPLAGSIVNAIIAIHNFNAYMRDYYGR
jgi:hypothetical protein